MTHEDALYEYFVKPILEKFIKEEIDNRMSRFAVNPDASETIKISWPPLED